MTSATEKITSRRSGMGLEDALKSNVPLLYDNFVHADLEWPCNACAWGAVHSTTKSSIHQTLLYGRSTDAKAVVRGEQWQWRGHPNMLLVARVRFMHKPTEGSVKPFTEGSPYQFIDERPGSLMVTKKRIVHPGEVNRIKACPVFPSLVATHTDSPFVYLWNIDTQPTRRPKDHSEPNCPDLVLSGHLHTSDDFFYGLDFSGDGERVISGGGDQLVCLWSLQDFNGSAALAGAGGAGVSDAKHTSPAPIAPLASASAPNSMAMVPASSTASSSSGVKADKTGPKSNGSLKARRIFRGHEGKIEDCVFHPSHPDIFVSVGSDRLLIFWDARSSQPVAHKLANLHRSDINSVSWSAMDPHYVATGGSDEFVRVLDLRRVSSLRDTTHRVTRCDARSAVVDEFPDLNDNVTHVQFSPHSSDHIVAASEDGRVLIYDRSRRSVALGRRRFPSASVAPQAASVPLSPVESVLRPTVDGPPSPPSVITPSLALSDLRASPLLSVAAPSSSPLHHSTRNFNSRVLFRHAGHNHQVTSVQWNPHVDFAFCTSSSGDPAQGGGFLQVWRVSELLWRETEQLSRCLRQFGSSATAAVTATATATAAATASTYSSPSSLSPTDQQSDRDGTQSVLSPASKRVRERERSDRSAGAGERNNKNRDAERPDSAPQSAADRARSNFSINSMEVDGDDHEELVLCQ